MLTGTRLAFIGVGVMGEAVIRGLLTQELVPASAMIASHPREARRQYLTATFGIRSVPDNRDAAAEADIVVLAVKPQVLPSVLRDVRQAVPPHAFVLSMIAGVRIQTIVDGLLHPAVARCMPNTPAQVGEGMSVWTATPEVSAAQREQASKLLRALGPHLWMEKEEYLDMATAVSGTGPAYVFLLMEALIDAAVHLGFSRADARQLVIQTIRGAAAFAEHAAVHPAELRNMVTSPGGTTAAALYQLEKGGFRTVVSKAVWAAYQRSVSLGQLKSVDTPGNAEGEVPNGLSTSERLGAKE